jgi:hypothetical protein
MESTTNTVTFTHRTAANALVKRLRIKGFHTDATLVEAAIMWESFPALHSVEQIELANALLVAEYGSGEWFVAGCAIHTIINK